MDVNEKIINEWLHLCENKFTITNISLKVSGEKGGVNYSDIDILAVDKDGNFYDYEVKWRSVYRVSSNEIKKWIGKMVQKERTKKIKKMIGKKSYQKILVTTQNCLGGTEKKRAENRDKFKKKNIEIVFFEEIIKDLVDATKVLGRYDSQILQIIRMLKQLDVSL